MATESKLKAALRSPVRVQPPAALQRPSVDKARKFAAADEVLFGNENRGGAPVPTGGAPAVEAELGQDVVLNLPIEKVHDNDFNARAWYDPAITKQRATEIAVDGQKTPALAVPHPTISGEWMLVEGHYRKRALITLGKPTIKTIVRYDWTTPQDRFVQSWRANEERLANSPVDNALQWARAIDQGIVKNQDDLAALLQVSETTVSRTMAISGLSETALEKARSKPDIFSTSMLYELSVLAKGLQQDDLRLLMDRIEAEGWSRRDLERHKAERAGIKPRKQKETSRQHKIFVDAAQVGVIKDWDNGRVLLDVRIDDQAARELLVAELRKRFGLDKESSQLALRP